MKAYVAKRFDARLWSVVGPNIALHRLQQRTARTLAGHLNDAYAAGHRVGKSEGRTAERRKRAAARNLPPDDVSNQSTTTNPDHVTCVECQRRLSEKP